ncbi:MULTISPECIES: hypothetical protein, partial [unclassified Microcoleus]|uniref:hypothetical protein n=1 Tax=unclassified Microcoleus TaxID=2642155 RepID=UPI0025DF1D5A
PTNRPKIQETGFLPQSSHPHQDLGRNPVSEPPRLVQETGFLSQSSHPHQDLGRNPVSEPPRLVQETGFLR